MGERSPISSGADFDALWGRHECSVELLIEAFCE